MGKRLIAGLIVVGLAVGVWVLWPREGSDTTTTTLPVAAATTTSTTNATTTSSSTPDVTVSSTTTRPESHVVETVEEAEEILRALWFGWFEGIYNQDEDRIREVVGSQQFLDAGRNAFSSLKFVGQPALDTVDFLELEMLESTSDCIVLWVEADAPFIDAVQTTNKSVDVIRWDGDSWTLFSTWQYRNDLWEADCESRLESLS